MAEPHEDALGIFGYLVQVDRDPDPFSDPNCPGEVD
jgi:hypothetical protein